MTTNLFSSVRLTVKLFLGLTLLFSAEARAQTAPNDGAPQALATATGVRATDPGAALVHPEYPGGDVALIQFLSQNLRYPADAYKDGVEGKVVVSFWIDEKGHPYGFGVLQSLHPSLDAEALRALKMMPDWTPGQREGKLSPMVVHIPVVFRRPAGK